ncbi:hypothetical protein AGMMS50267_18480 [Spirochaetia bacterium]|nr:hypothetical protein AGMMS50267_18480 [Spirochaetia bacterium]
MIKPDSSVILYQIFAMLVKSHFSGLRVCAPPENSSNFRNFPLSIEANLRTLPYIR